MAEKASYWRNHLKTRLTSVAERRRFWERVFRGRFASLMQAGNEPPRRKFWKMNWIIPAADR
jgi:uroporphyrin-III C-methyltransferase/precorrin-2 dehydrogenase/sirohydrochlorin ferrochelatase